MYYSIYYTYRYYTTDRVGVKLCRFVGKPRLLLIQQRNFWDFVGKLQEKV